MDCLLLDMGMSLAGYGGSLFPARGMSFSGYVVCLLLGMGAVSCCIWSISGSASELTLDIAYVLYIYF